MFDQVSLPQRLRIISVRNTHTNPMQNVHSLYSIFCMPSAWNEGYFTAFIRIFNSHIHTVKSETLKGAGHFCTSVDLMERKDVTA